MLPTRIQPSSWLVELAKTKPAVWRWNRAIRAGICVGLPLGLGFLTGYLALGVWMSIASLIQISGENNASYRSRFKLIAIASGIGSLGCLVGYAAALPWLWVVLLMALLAFTCGIISNYGAPFSMGTLQFLVLAAVALGRPQIAPFWEPMLYYLTGAAFYALVMGIEALLVRVQPRRQMAASLVAAMSKLAQDRAQALESRAAAGAEAGAAQVLAVEESRRAVTSQIAALYADILNRSTRRVGRTSETDGLWAMLQCCDFAFAAILSATSVQSLRNASINLAAIAKAIGSGKKHLAQIPIPAQAGQSEPLDRAISAMAAAGLSSHSPFSPLIMPVADNVPARARSQSLRILRDRLLPGRQTVRSSLALALCVGIAYAVHWLDKDSRWYWVPLTVSIVMKPDFGSLFARSLLRSAGTLVGVVLGSVILLLLPKGTLLLIIIALLAACIPWAGQRSYAILGIVITPLVLVLIDLTVPGSMNVNYGMQRFVGTVIGSGIVLVFGYFLWPRTHFREITDVFQRASRAICQYLLAVSDEAQTSGKVLSSIIVSRSRRQAYSGLMDLRTRLQKAMADPPPTGSEATAWLPIVASAERICDRITAYSVNIDGQVRQSGQPALRQLAQEIAQVCTRAPLPAPDTPADATPEDADLIRRITGELRFIHSSTEPPAEDAPLPQPSAPLGSGTAA